ncbi:MAG: helix-turn-helix domain-containing protein [Pseudonocardiaceae bacterium]|nr:helix-turn-helix domain-containing protein [Pseudonocardiaceae bacterium]
MPRPERPVDPAAGVVQGFAFELRKLRRDAGGLTYRELAARSGYSVTTLSHAAGGRRLPSLDVALAYAMACGGEGAEWEAKWHAAAVALAGQRPAPGTDAAPRAPYRGLGSFRTDDADLFFGREQLVIEVVRRVSEQRLVVVLGASGTGKTSLLAAGVLPALRARADVADLRSVMVTPGERPWRNVRAALAGSAVGGTEPDRAVVERVLDELPDGAELLVIVDQFEELYTRCGAEERTEFIDGMLALAARPDRRCRVVIGVRADFYGRCAEHAELAGVLRDNQILVAPMRADELREAVSRPAAAVGLSVERALLATIVRDAEGQPGALPLISHAMLETWRRRRGEVLTLAGYQSAGGINGALVQTAEAAYDGLGPARQRLAADLLLRLIVLAEDVAAASRRVELAELLDVDPDADTVLARLIDARLLTADEDSVEIAHESLIEHWPRLRDWLAEDREGLRIHHQLSEATRGWQEMGRDPSGLYRGTRLAVATDWIRRAGHRVHLTTAEREFLDTSIEAETSQRATEQRRTRLLRRLATALALFSVAALAATAVAFVQAGRARQANDQARSRQLAAEARLLAATNVAAALRKSVDAYRAAPTEEARSVVLSMPGMQGFHGKLAGHAGRLDSLAVTPDGTRAVSGGQDRRAVVWDIPGRRALRTLNVGVRVRDVAVSQDGRLAAVAARNGSLSLWRMADGAMVARPRGHRGSVESVAFSPDGRRLLSVDASRTVIVWDTGGFTARATIRGYGGMNADVAVNPESTVAAVAGDDGSVTLLDVITGKPRETRATGTGRLYAVAFHPSNGGLVAGGDANALFHWDRDRKLRRLPTNAEGRVHDLTFQADGDRLYCGCGRQTMVWDTTSGAVEASLGPHTGVVYAVASSADSGVVASGGADGAVLLWDRDRLPLLRHTAGVQGLAVSPDGRTLASAGADHTVALWNPAERSPRELRNGHTQGVSAVAYHPRGRLLASASYDHTVAVWDTQPGNTAPPTVLRHPDRVYSVAFHSTRRALFSGGADGRVLRWRLDEQAKPTELQRHVRPVQAVAVDPRGRHLASAGRDGRVLLTDLRGPNRSTNLAGHPGPINRLTFSPDGRHLVAGGARGDILVWDIRAPGEPPERLTGHTRPVVALAFSPDGRYLASGGNEHTVIVWDFANRARWTTLTGHTDNVLSAAWSRDGKVLYTGGADRSIIPWTVDPDTATAGACRQLARDFPRSGARSCS